MSDRVFANRLLKLAERLDDVSAREFDMDVFTFSCGTPACALGYAAMIPSFRRAGLRLNERTVYFREYIDFYVAVEFFGMTIEEAAGMFTKRQGHSTPKQVASNLRKFVRKKYPHLRLEKAAGK